MRIAVCHLKCDVSNSESIGVGKTQPEALGDAIKYFADVPPDVVKGRIKKRIVRPIYYEREVRT